MNDPARVSLNAPERGDALRGDPRSLARLRAAWQPLVQARREPEVDERDEDAKP